MHPHDPGLTRSMLRVLCGLAVAAAPPPAAPAPDASADAAVMADTLVDFDIPAQPLEDALYQYGDISRQPALFSSSLLAGLTSSPVRGRLTADAALRQLLAGTGLVAEPVVTPHGRTFMLRRPSGRAAPDPVPSAALDGYPGLVQARIWQALCDDPRTAPGAYQALFRVRVDGGGRVRDARLLQSSGDAYRDVALLATLGRVSIGAPPPRPELRRPFVMSLQPAAAGVSPCRPAGASR
ncbi:secretin and TonB N-terminal domain-containing protein [Bordetella ansorpii]|nr:secretin and TonB N-terminal domain-containing protein [Bordetella ansorpii]